MGFTERTRGSVWAASFRGEVSSELGRCFKSALIQTPLDGPPEALEKESFSAQKSKKTTLEKKFSFKRKLSENLRGDKLRKYGMLGTIIFQIPNRQIPNQTSQHCVFRYVPQSRHTPTP
jgi:hypothetical protein